MTYSTVILLLRKGLCRLGLLCSQVSSRMLCTWVYVEWALLWFIPQVLSKLLKVWTSQDLCPCLWPLSFMKLPPRFCCLPNSHLLPWSAQDLVSASWSCSQRVGELEGSLRGNELEESALPHPFPFLHPWFELKLGCLEKLSVFTGVTSISPELS